MKFGIIGYGRMGKVYKNVLSDMDIDIDFICDKDESNFEKDIKFYSDFNQAIDNSVIDGIIVSTHGPSHHKIVKKAIEKKIKYVVCEKPFTTSVKHAMELVDMLKQSKTQLTVNYSRRFSKTYSDLKQKLYEEKVIGEPRAIIITCGAGGLSMVGTHFFDLCTLLLKSKVRSINAIPLDKNYPNPRGEEFHDPGGYVLMTFENNCRAYFDMGDDLGITPLIEIIGEYGRIIIDETKKEIIISARTHDDKSKPKHLYGLPNPIIEKTNFNYESMSDLITNMLKNLIFDQSSIFTPEMAKEKVEIYSAIRESFATNSTVKLPLKDDFYNKEFMVP